MGAGQGVWPVPRPPQGARRKTVRGTGARQGGCRAVRCLPDTTGIQADLRACRGAPPCQGVRCGWNGGVRPWGRTGQPTGALKWTSGLAAVGPSRSGGPNSPFRLQYLEPYAEAART